MPSHTEQIKSRLSILDVVGSYVKLERAGSNYKARCPFHNEKTASFFVSPGRDTYHCFGCNRGGDIFSFIQEAEGLDFFESLKLLAERAGVPLDSIESRFSGEKDRLYALLEDATVFFTEHLYKRKDVLGYLEERGLTPETIKNFRLGFSPNAWRDTILFLSRKGYTPGEIVKAGLAIQKSDARNDGKDIYYDRFRGRVMFPTENSTGRIVGFSGRIFDGEARVSSESDIPPAKYINTPQTMLYDKSHILYGYAKAKDAMRKEGVCILVEGQMDVILSHQAGFSNTVGVSGTALTTEHVTLIRRLSDTLILAFDADAAGRNAMESAAKKALNVALTVKAISFDGKKDPADFIRDDESTYKKLLQEAPHVVLFLMAVLRKEEKDALSFKRAVQKHVIPILAVMGNKIEQSHFTAGVAEGLGVKEDILYEEIARSFSEKDSANGESTTLPSLQIVPVKRRKDRIIEQVTGVMLWQESLSEKILDVSLIHKTFTEILDIPFDVSLQAFPEEEKSRLLFEAEMFYANSGNLTEILEELFMNLREEVTKEALRDVLQKIKKAEQEDNQKLVLKYLEECKILTSQLNKIKSRHLNGVFSNI